MTALQQTMFATTGDKSHQIQPLTDILRGHASNPLQDGCEFFFIFIFLTLFGENTRPTVDGSDGLRTDESGVEGRWKQQKKRDRTSCEMGDTNILQGR